MGCEIGVDTQQGQMRLSGELTIFTVGEIRNRLVETLGFLPELAVDLGEVTDIDTAGLQLMLLAKLKPGSRVRFCNHSDEVLRLIDLANLGQTLGDPLVLKAQ